MRYLIGSLGEDIDFSTGAFYCSRRKTFPGTQSTRLRLEFASVAAEIKTPEIIPSKEN